MEKMIKLKRTDRMGNDRLTRIGEERKPIVIFRLLVVNEKHFGGGGGSIYCVEIVCSEEL